MTITSHGYKIFHKNGKNIYEHRYFMENKLGRKLDSNEIVHHVNGDKLDNRLENLEVILRADHNKHHFFSDPKKVKNWKDKIMQLGINATMKEQTECPQNPEEGTVWRKYYIDKNGMRKGRAFIASICKNCKKIIWKRYYRSYKITKKIKPCIHREPS